MTIPLIIHQTWKDTTSIPTDCIPFIQSWKTNHPTWRINMYTDAQNLAFVTEYFPQYLAMYNGYKYSIQRVDLIRVLYLKKYGGVYADIDILDYKNVAPLLVGQTLVLTTLRDGTTHVSNAWMASEPNHPYWDAVLEEMVVASKTPYTGNKVKDVHEKTGSIILSKLVKDFKDIKLLPRITFHPIQWHERSIVKKTVPTLIPPLEYGVHIYQSSWI